MYFYFTTTWFYVIADGLLVARSTIHSVKSTSVHNGFILCHKFVKIRRYTTTILVFQWFLVLWVASICRVLFIY